MKYKSSKPRPIAMLGAAVLVASLPSIVASRAADSGSVVAYYGPGTSTCEKFTAVEAVDTHPDANASTDAVNAASEALELQGVYRTWLQGYLTATNEQMSGAADILDGADFDGAIAWIADYCKRSPAAQLGAAAHAFVLVQRKKRPAPKQGSTTPSAAARAKPAAAAAPASSRLPADP